MFEGMAEQRRWVNWTPQKRPLDPVAGRWASVTDPATWGTLAQAQERDPDHVGIVLGWGLGCIDLDHCLRVDGALTDGAQAIVDFYPGNYVEISPSGQGLHIFGTAPQVRGLRRTWRGQSVEMYTRARYITVTGNTWQAGDLLPL